MKLFDVLDAMQEANPSGYVGISAADRSFKGEIKGTGIALSENLNNEMLRMEVTRMTMGTEQGFPVLHISVRRKDGQCHGRE